MDSKQEMQTLIESEAAQDAMERVAVGNDPSLDPFRAIADKRAKKILKKNKREIERLKKHAEQCLYEMNREGYIYAIGKIRTIIRKPMDEETLGVLYETSLERIITLAKEAIEQNAKRGTMGGV